MTSLEQRILDCFPSGSYALTALLRLMEIVESRDVPTAAVECRLQPRLLVNPDFADSHASTPERLLMLVMHELHHVLLGHTTLFKTVTRADNFVFDCVINALISRMFPVAEYLCFLTDYYSDKRFPECMLRPPSGYDGSKVKKLPAAIRDLSGDRGETVAEVYRGLYSETGATYRELYSILPRLLDEAALDGVPLLGGHGDDSATAGDIENRSPVLFDVVRSIVEEWPQPPDPIAGRSFADILDEASISTRTVPGNRAILRGLFRKLATSSLAGQVRRISDDHMLVPTPIPTLDRRSIVQRALGAQPLFYTGSVSMRRRRPSGDLVHVYVDVSGSMDGIKDAIYGALSDCREWIHPNIHLFSTRISDITRNDLRRGVVKSTGGTDGACIARHMQKNRISRACIITDGWVGKPRGANHTTLSSAKLGIAYAGQSVNTNDLSAVSDHVATLKL